MNWSGAKSILIVFFLIINIIFFVILAETDHSIYNVDPEIMKSTVELLNKSQITVNEDIIPKKNPKIKYAEGYNVITDKLLFAKNMLGENALEKDGMYISDIGELSISGDSFNAVYYNKDYFNISGYSGINKKVRRIFEILEFNDIGEIISDKDGEKYNIEVKNIVDGKYFFDSVLKIVMTEDRVESISGEWFSADCGIMSGSEDIKSVTGALVDFMRENKGEAMEITGIDIGYYKGGSEVYHRSAVLIPVWRITLSDGNLQYIDARVSQ